jgi:hypothetical protein
MKVHIKESHNCRSAAYRTALSTIARKIMINQDISEPFRWSKQVLGLEDAAVTERYA